MNMQRKHSRDKTYNVKSVRGFNSSIQLNPSPKVTGDERREKEEDEEADRQTHFHSPESMNHPTSKREE